MVYIIHFESKLHHAQHYVGSTKNLEQRLARHRQAKPKTKGDANLIGVINEKGIPWQLATTIEGGREMERRIKARHNTPKLCPICNPK